jgi:hypothetical protein
VSDELDDHIEELAGLGDEIDEEYAVDYGDDWDDPCDRCGPSCPDWGGDGLCMIQINQQAEENRDFQEKCVVTNYYCPVCGKPLTLYKIPVDELWVWPGDFYNPIIALNIFSVYDAPKGELHRSGNIVHIWVGDPAGDNQKLIQLGGKA